MSSFSHRTFLGQGQFIKQITVKWPISLRVSGRFLVESGRFHIFDDVIVNYRSSVHSPDEVHMVPFLDVIVVQLVRQQRQQSLHVGGIR